MDVGGRVPKVGALGDAWSNYRGLDNFVWNKIGQTKFARSVKYRDVFHQPRPQRYELELK